MSDTGELDFFSIYSPAAGSTRVRLYDWARHLNLSPCEHQFAGLPNAGIGTLARHPKTVALAEAKVRRANTQGRTAVMSREASPFSRGEVEERVLREAGYSVYDFDDALFLDTSRRRRAFGGAQKFERAVAAADVVIAGNDYLADWASQFHDDVRVIPSCVEPDDYVVADHEMRAGAVPTIVWLGSRSTEQYVAAIAPQLLQVHRRTGARLKLISSPTENPALASLKPMMDRIAWSPSGFAEELANADVAIAPLEDTPFARGKCAYKILQYGAAGLPIIGSPVGANRQALERLGGAVANTRDEWVDALSAALMMSSASRAHRGYRAHESLRRHYSFLAWANAWTETVRTA